MAKIVKKRNKKYNHNAATFNKVSAVWESVINRFSISTIDKFSPCPFFLEEFVTRLTPQETDVALIRFTNFCYKENNPWVVLFAFGTSGDNEDDVRLTPVKMTIQDTCLYDLGIMFDTLLEQAKIYSIENGSFNREDILGYGYTIVPDGGLVIDEIELSLGDKILTETEWFTKFRDMDDHPVSNDVIMTNIQYVINNAKRVKHNLLNLHR